MDERDAVSKRVVPVLAAAVAVAVFGACSGYVAAEQLGGPPSSPSDDSTAQAPEPVQTDAPLPHKTPIPNDVPALVAAELDYRAESFTVHTKPNPPVRVTLRAPRTWDLRSNPKGPQEVRFVDPTGQRALRVESGFTPSVTTEKSMAKLIRDLEASQPYENSLQIRSQSTGSVVGPGGESRTISTLSYTYIPEMTVRHVMVRWVATEGGNATVEMSATGLPQDAKALEAVLEEATRSVRRTD